MLGLEYFSFAAVWSPIGIMITLAIIAAYLLITGAYRDRIADAEQVKISRKILFISGVVLLYVAVAGPLDILGHMMFSAHMTAMSIAYIIVPPMIMLGIPSWLWIAFIKRLRILSPLSFMMKPIFTVVLFNMLFSFYHVPQIHDFVMTHYLLHIIVYIILFITSVMMWWHVIVPVATYSSISELGRMGYLFLMGMLLTPACALIIFAGSSSYALYNDPEVWVQAMGFCVPGDTSFLLTKFQGPSYFALLSPIEDQQLGGILMKLVQEFMYGGILAYVFRQWYRRENKSNKIDDLNSASGMGGNGNLNGA